MVDLPDGYKPCDNEPFMNGLQKEYFRQKLTHWRETLIQDSSSTVRTLQHKIQETDVLDIATQEINESIELRARDRERKLLNKINEALQRLDDGTYGYCEETGEPISLQRLEARPTATLSIEAQERHEWFERMQKQRA